MARSLLCTALCGLAVAGGAAIASAQTQRWNSWAEIGGYAGTDHASRGEMALWLPLWQQPGYLGFLDARGKIFEGGALEGNVALGYRNMLASGWNFGIWGGYDARRSPSGNTFHQLSGGLELLSDSFDLRFNGYLPVTGPQAGSGAATVFLTGNQILMQGASEIALGGFDAEAGFTAWKMEADGGARHALRLFAGGFYFDAASAARPVAGPKARAEWRIDNVLARLPGSRLTFEAEASYDAVRGARFEAGARFRIPFGGNAVAALPPSAQWARMAEGLERDTDIIVGPSGSEAVEDAQTGTDFNQVAIVTGATGIAGNPANTLIVATGDSGNYTGSGFTSSTLDANQTLLGAGTALIVRGRSSGQVAPFTYAGTMPIFQNAINGGHALTFGGDNGHVSGMGFAQGTGSSAGFGILAADGRTNLLVDYVTMNIASYASGVGVGDNNSNITIASSTFANTVSSGITISEGNSAIVIRDSTFTSTSYNSAGVSGAIRIGTGNAVTIADVTFDGGASTITGIPSVDLHINQGLSLGQSNTVTADRMTLLDAFRANGIFFESTGNTLNGAGNTTTATFPSGALCQDNGNAWSGTITINGAGITSAGCP